MNTAAKQAETTRILTRAYNRLAASAIRMAWLVAKYKEQDTKERTQ